MISDATHLCMLRKIEDAKHQPRPLQPPVARAKTVSLESPAQGLPVVVMPFPSQTNGSIETEVAAAGA